MIKFQLIKYSVLLLLSISILTSAKINKCSDKLSCDCGSSTIDKHTRIINGEEAIPCSWPMIVSLRYDFLQLGNPLTHSCGGTIISESYILTAASCLEGILYGDIDFVNVTIAAAIHNRSQSHQIIREVDQALIHEDWAASANGYQHDIALLHLSQPLDLRKACISRICLPPQLSLTEELIEYPPVDTRLAVIGWGRTDINSDDSDVLRQAFVFPSAYNDPKCSNVVNDSKTQFCAGLFNSTNTGDFGGPILSWIGDRWEQVGIASFTSNGCKENSSIVYTRLAYYHDWIEEHIKSNEEVTEGPPIIITLPPIDTTNPPLTTYYCNKRTIPCGCGHQNVQFPDLATVRPSVAVPYSWSMIVSIRLNGSNKHSCSGSILSESYILTSASCIDNVPIFGISIVAGVHNHSEKYPTYSKIDQIFIHPGYKRELDNYANDIAILHMSQLLDFDRDLLVSRTCLPDTMESNSNLTTYPESRKQLALIGWGRMDCQNKSDPYVLQQVQIYSIDHTAKSCFVLDKHSNIQFCAGVNETGTIPCVGDPGSPIFEWLGDRWQQVGIASHRIDCAPLKNSGIYTRIVKYNKWIQSIISNCSTSWSTTTTTSTTKVTTTATGITMNTTVDMITTTTRVNVYQCNQTSKCGCGANPAVISSSRIVGGENAVENSWPMVVSLRLSSLSSHDCGGTILSNSYILTAAHCVIQFLSESPVGVSIGTGMINISDPKQIRRIVDRVHIHPNYIGSQDGYRHDIALLHINESLAVEQNNFLTKTCIHAVKPPMLSDQYIKNGTRLIVIGWGAFKENWFELPTMLQQVEVYAMDNDDSICQNSINNSTLQFCAGIAEGGKDSCQGDSGGPIFKWTGQYWEQLGIVSYGNGCAQPGEPGIYTRLSYYYDWMNNILKNNSEHLEPEFPLDITTTITDTTTIRTETTTIRTDTTTIRTDTTTTMNRTVPNTKSDSFNHKENALLCSIVITFLTIML